MKTPSKIHEVDKVSNNLVEDIELLLEKAKKDTITGYSIVTVNKGDSFSTSFSCKSRLELLGALQMAVYDVSKLP